MGCRGGRWRRTAGRVDGHRRAGCMAGIPLVGVVGNELAGGLVAVVTGLVVGADLAEVGEVVADGPQPAAGEGVGDALPAGERAGGAGSGVVGGRKGG